MVAPWIVYSNKMTQGRGWQHQKNQPCDWSVETLSYFIGSNLTSGDGRGTED